MTSILIEGMLAGYGIAIPVGAISVLIVETTLCKGFTAGFVAGSGTATVDFLFAALAAVAGSVLGTYLEPYAESVRIASSILLVVLGLFGLRRSFRIVAPKESADAEAGYWKLYVQFLLLTAVNPLTVIYFSALILGGALGDSSTIVERTIFVLGAGFASFSWQSLLALVGAVLRRGISPRVRVALSLAGNFVVVALGLRILLQG